MKISARKKMMAWVLALCLTVTMIPSVAFGTSSAGETQKIAPEDVTEENVIEKFEDMTTYDLAVVRRCLSFMAAR